MNRWFRLAATATVVLMLSLGTAQADIIGGIDFPEGAVSFADAVVSFNPGPDVGTNYDDPGDALGVPDYDGTSMGSVSLGEGGVLILRFVNNSLTTSGDATPDIHVFEIGAVVEVFNLAISTNGVNWIDLGDVSGQPTSVDIDPIAGVVAGTLYSYVRLTDVAPGQSGSPFGEADIDAVGAISSGAPVPTPEPTTLLMLGLGLLGMVACRKRGA